MSNDWNDKRRLEIIKGQTANQLVQIQTARMKIHKTDFNLKAYEEEFPKLLEVNKRLLLGGDDNE